MICQEVKTWRIQGNFSIFANSEIINEQTDFLKIVRERIPINVIFVKQAISYFKSAAKQENCLECFQILTNNRLDPHLWL